MQVTETWSYEVGEERAYADNLMGDDVSLHVKWDCLVRPGSHICFGKDMVVKIYEGRKDQKKEAGSQFTMPDAQ